MHNKLAIKYAQSTTLRPCYTALCRQSSVCVWCVCVGQTTAIYSLHLDQSKMCSKETISDGHLGLYRQIECISVCLKANMANLCGPYPEQGEEGKTGKIP